MLKLYIGSAYEPKEVVAEEDQTVKEIYAENGVALPQNSLVTLNSRKLGDAELNKPISELGVVSEDAITITEKYSSAKI